MKNIIILTLVIFATVGPVASQSNVGIGTISPDQTAKLDVTSTSQGLLIPRMTQAQRNAINSPATSLTIFQTDMNSGFYYYDGSSWRMLGDNLGSHLATQVLNMDTNKIVNVPTPVNGLDAVNKDYVDAAIASGGGAGTLGCNMPTELSNESPSGLNLGKMFLYCDTLTEGGNTDWILPNRDQLTYAVAGGTIVPGTRSTLNLWTRTSLDGSSHVFIRLSDGAAGAAGGTNTVFYCRCVR